MIYTTNTQILYIIVPYLNSEVAENICDMSQQKWSGKYGSTETSSIISSMDENYVRMDGYCKTPNKTFGLAIQDDHY